MKTTLLFLVAALAASADARHDIDTLLEGMERYLGPDEMERREVRGIPVDRTIYGKDLLEEKRETEMCGNCPHVPLTEAEKVAQSCTSDQKEIAPVFEKPNGVEFQSLDCTCLKEYICCPNPCPAMKTKKKLCNQIRGCKQLTDYQGYYRFGTISDCCGCKRRHITKCSKPKPVLCPKCETFVGNHQLDEFGCYVSGCEVTPHPVYPPADCDLRCQSATTVKVECGYNKPACLDIHVDDCHPEKPEPNKCQAEPTKILKKEYTIGTGGNTCSQCYTWAHVTKPTTVVPIDCDDNCQTKERIEDACGNVEEKCSTNNPHEPCYPAKPAQDVCKEPWLKKNKEEWNFNHTSNSCKQCHNWKAELKAIVKKPAECNANCFQTVREADECGGWEEHCEANKCKRAECRPIRPTEKSCYDPAEKNPDTGVYCANGDGCDQCWDWKEPVLTPCAPTIDTCHRFEEDLPDMCFEMIDIKGECCDSKSCAKKEEQCVQKFASEDVEEACPAGSVLITGTSTCGVTRHLCYPCPQFRAAVLCDEKCHDLEKVNNMFGCEEQRCVKKACPAPEMPICDYVAIASNECGCPIIKCTEAPICAGSEKMDIQLIVDASGSVGSKNFRKQMDAIADNLIPQFDIGEDKTRFALYRFSSKHTSKSIYRLNSFTDLHSLQKATKATEYPRGRTYTAYAMEESLKLFKQNLRKDATKVCFIFTDGVATDAKDLDSARESWEKEGIKVYAIGLGRNIKKSDLAKISGDGGRVLNSEDFSGIGEIIKPVLKTICESD